MSKALPKTKKETRLRIWERIIGGATVEVTETEYQWFYALARKEERKLSRQKENGKIFIALETSPKIQDLIAQANIAIHEAHTAWSDALISAYDKEAEVRCFDIDKSNHPPECQRLWRNYVNLKKLLKDYEAERLGRTTEGG